MLKRRIWLSNELKTPNHTNTPTRYESALEWHTRLFRPILEYECRVSEQNTLFIIHLDVFELFVMSF